MVNNYGRMEKISTDWCNTNYSCSNVCNTEK